MQSNNKFFVITSLMVIGACARLMPHMPNFTPLESITIFGAAYLSQRYYAVLIPVLVIYFSDFIINNTVARSFFDQDGIVWFDQYMIFNVLAIFAIVLFSSRILKKVNVLNVVYATLGASVLFFLITNFGSWASEKSIYPNDFNGLLMSYTAGLPFFRTSLLSDAVFSLILFGGYEVIQYLSMKKAFSKI